MLMRSEFVFHLVLACTTLLLAFPRGIDGDCLLADVDATPPTTGAYDNRVGAHRLRFTPTVDIRVRSMRKKLDQILGSDDYIFSYDLNCDGSFESSTTRVDDGTNQWMDYPDFDVNAGQCVELRVENVDYATLQTDYRTCTADAYYGTHNHIDFACGQYYYFSSGNFGSGPEGEGFGVDTIIRYAPRGSEFSIAAPGAGSFTETGSPVLSYTVTRDRVNQDVVTVKCRVQGGTATQGAIPANDYLLQTTGNINFADGVGTGGVCNIKIGNDNIAEPDTDSLVIELYDEAGLVCNTNPAAASRTITDDDTFTVSLSSNAYTFDENNGATQKVTIVSTKQSSLTFQVDLTFADGSAAGGGVDYTGTKITVTYPAFTTSLDVTIPVTNDNIAEPAETFSVTLSNIQSDGTGKGSVGGTTLATVTISANDPFDVDIAGGPYTFDENAAASTHKITLATTRPSQYTFDVDITFTANTALGGGTDFTSTKITHTFPAMSTSDTVLIPINNDNLAEWDEDFNAHIGNIQSDTTGMGTVAGTLTVLVTISANDPFQVNFAVVSDTVAEAAGSLAIEAVRTGGEGDFSVPVNFADGTATGNGYDYTSTTITYSFGTAVNSVTENVPIIDDGWVDLASETFTASFGAITYGTGIGSGTTGNSKPTNVVTITDNDSCAVTAATRGRTDGTDNTVVITGTGFGPSTTQQGGGTATWVVTVGSTTAVAPVVHVSDTELTITVPEGQGHSLDVTVSTDGGNNGQLPCTPVVAAYTYLDPVITAMSPYPVPKRPHTTTLYGDNFGRPALNKPVIAVSDGLFAGALPVTCTSVNTVTHTEMTCDLSPGMGPEREINITVESLVQTISPLMNVTYLPVDVTSFAPPRLPANAPGTLTVYGTDFAPLDFMEVNLGHPTEYTYRPKVCNVTAGSTLDVMHTTMTCELEKGVGMDMEVTVTVGPEITRTAANDSLVGNDTCCCCGLMTTVLVPTLVEQSATCVADPDEVASLNATEGEFVVNGTATMPAGDVVGCLVSVNVTMWGYNVTETTAVNVTSETNVTTNVTTNATELVNVTSTVLVDTVQNTTAYNQTVDAPTVTANVSIMVNTTVPAPCIDCSEDQCMAQMCVAFAELNGNLTGYEYDNHTSPSLFSYDIPVVTSASQTNTYGGWITIWGDHFGAEGPEWNRVEAFVRGTRCEHAEWITPTSLHCEAPIGSGRDLSVEVIVGDQRSPENTLFTYLAPTISNVVGELGVAYAGPARDSTLSIFGDNFFNTTTYVVIVNGAPYGTGGLCATTFVNYTFVTCQMPAAAGPGWEVRVRVGNTTAFETPNSQEVIAATNFTFDPPVVTAASPTALTRGQNITVHGTNFGGDMWDGWDNVWYDEILTGGTSCGNRVRLSHTAIRCEVVEGQGNDIDVVVTVGSQNSSDTGSIVFSYVSPNITAIYPNPGTKNGFVLTMYGTNFGDSARDSDVTVDVSMHPAGQPAVTCTGVDVVSDTELQCNISAGSGNDRVFTVTVANQTDVGHEPWLHMNWIDVNVTAISPARLPDNGGTLTVYGFDFAPVDSNHIVRAGSYPCTNPQVDIGQTVVTCEMPFGVGQHHEVVVTVVPDLDVNSTNPVDFSYDIPVVTAVDRSTTPGSLITVHGYNFGWNNTVVNVTLDGSTCGTPTWVSESMIRCLPVEGAGTNHSAIVAVPDQWNVQYNVANELFSYLPPTLLNIVPTHGRVRGNETILLNGTDFGAGLPNDRNVSIGGTACASFKWLSHYQLECVTPSGFFLQRPVVLTVSGQLSDSDILGTLTYNAAMTPGQITASTILFDYDRPVVESITPATGPAVGGTTLTLHGYNFGMESWGIPTPFIDVGGTACTSPTHVSDTEMTCVTPHGVGVNATVYLNVTHRDNADTVAMLFTYHAPSVSAVFGGETWNVDPNVPWNGPETVVNGTVIKRAPAIGGTVITVVGVDFGFVDFGAQVRINGDPCAASSWISDTNIECTLAEGMPPLVDITVEVGNQTGGNSTLLAFYPHWNVTEPTLTGPARGDTKFNMTGWGFNATDGYRCVFTQVEYRDVYAWGWNATTNTSYVNHTTAFVGVNVAKSAPIMPTSRHLFECTTPEWPFTAATAVVTLEDSLGNTLDQAGSMTFDFWEDFDFVLPFSAMPGVDTTFVMHGGGYNVSDTTYRCLLTYTNDTNPYVVNSGYATPVSSSQVMCDFTGVQTFPFGDPEQRATITLHRGLAEFINQTAMVNKSSDGPWGDTCCNPFVAGDLQSGTKSLSPGDLVFFVTRPPLKPAAPTLIALTPWTVTINWPQPTMASLGGIIMDGLYLRRNGTDVWTTLKFGDHLDLSTAVGDLWPERSYAYQLVFENAVGLSEPSDPLEVVLPPSEPIISAVTVDNGRTHGGRVVTITGAQFGHTASDILAVHLGGPGSLPSGLTTAPARWVSPSLIEVVSPEHLPGQATPGTWIVNVTSKVGSSDVLETPDPSGSARPINDKTYTYNPLPNVTSIVPDYIPRLVPGLAAGGVIVELYGQHLGVDAVDFLSASLGDVPCIAGSTVHVSDTHVTCMADVSPAEQRNPVGVETFKGGLGLSAPLRFWYTVPVVQTTIPGSGAYVGGLKIGIRGLWLGTGPDDIISVEIGEGQFCTEIFWFKNTLEPLLENEATIQCLTPPTTKIGLVNVRVNTISGGMGTWAVDAFEYTRGGPFASAPPNVTAVIPPWGSTEGNMPVTLRGTNLGGNALDMTGVSLSGIPCENKDWISSTEVRCTTGSIASRVPVRSQTFVPEPVKELAKVVTVTGGPSEEGEIFWYRWPVPTIVGVRPRVSGNAGGARVYLSGEWYLPYDSSPTAYMQGVECKQTTWVDEKTVICLTPAVGQIDPVAVAAKELEFSIEVEGQVSALFKSRFEYGIECDPPCGWNAECEPDTSGVPRCRCHPFWAEPPNCEQSMIKFTNVTGRFTSEDGDSATVTVELLRNPDGASPTSDVRFSVESTDATEQAIVAGDTNLVFTPATWSVPQTFVLEGRTDPETGAPLRDGDQPSALHVTGVSSDDKQYAGMPVPDYVVPNRDARPTITKVSKDISATAGSNLTITGAHFDPYVAIELIPEDGGAVLNTSVVHYVIASATGVVVDMHAVRRLRTLESVVDGGGRRRGSAHVPSSSSSTSTPLTTLQVASTNLTVLNASLVPAETHKWDTVVFQTPPRPTGSYYTIRLVNKGNGRMPAPAHATRQYPTKHYYTDDCPEEGQYGIGNDCRPCPEGAFCPGGPRMWPLPGYWNPGEDSGFVIKCEVPEACMQGDASGGVCAPGYAGRMCASCDDGYYKDQQTKRCNKCPESEGMIIYLLCDAIVWTCVAMAGWWLRDYENFSHTLGFVLALQQMGGMGKVVGDTGNSMITMVYEILHLFAGEYSFLKPDCLDPVPYHLQFATQLAYNVAIGVPLVGGMFIVKYFGIRRAEKFGPEARAQRKRFYDARHTRCVTAWLVVNYLSVAMLSVRTVLCRKTGGASLTSTGDGEDAPQWFLWADPNYECFTMEHWAIVGASAVLGFGYVLGFPLMYTRWIRSNKDKMFTDLDFQEAWNFSYEPFKDNLWYYYFMEFFISITIALGDTLLRQHIAFQSFAIGGVIFLNCFLLVVVRPFHRGWENWVTLCMNLTSLIGLTIGYFRDVQPGVLPDIVDTILIYTLLALMGITISCLLFVMIYYIFWHWTPNRRVQGDAGYWMDNAIKQQALGGGMLSGGGALAMDEFGDFDDLEEMFDQYAREAGMFEDDLAEEFEDPDDWRIKPDTFVADGDGVFYDSGMGDVPLPPPPGATDINAAPAGMGVLQGVQAAETRLENMINTVFDAVVGNAKKA